MTSSLEQEPRHRLFTLEQAKAMLPLVRSILTDVTALAFEVRDRQQRLLRIQAGGKLDPSREEELQHILGELDRGQGRMAELEGELNGLGVELKDYMTGLVDFRSIKDGREVYLCFRLNESTISHWHELDAGFAGRQPVRSASDFTAAEG